MLDLLVFTPERFAIGLVLLGVVWAVATLWEVLTNLPAAVPTESDDEPSQN